MATLLASRNNATVCLMLAGKFQDKFGVAQNVKLMSMFMFSAFNRMKACISEAADKAGRDVCAQKPKELFEQYINQMAGNTMELMCSDYGEDSDKCTRVMKMPFNQSKSKPPSSLLRAFGDLLVLE